MAKKFWFTGLSAFSLLLTGCEKEVDFKYRDIEPLTVIEGVLSENGAKVGITLTTPMDEPMDSTRLTDATVVLTDLSSGETIPLSPDADGYFVSSQKGVAGREYRLEVNRNGNSFIMTTPMLGPAEILSAEFEWIAMPYDEVAVLQVRYTDNPDINNECYWVRVYRNGKIYKWQEQSDRIADNGIMTFITMTTRRDIEAEDDDDLLLDGDVVTITVSPITREMHDYLEALANDSNGPQLFSGTTPSLGYFMATTTVSTSLIFHR